MPKTRSTRQAMKSHGYGFDRDKPVSRTRSNDRRPEEELWAENDAALARIMAAHEEDEKRKVSTTGTYEGHRSTEHEAIKGTSF